jgi:23S rRNA (uridine2552-2'-O)-methyltransferase
MPGNRGGRGKDPGRRLVSPRGRTASSTRWLTRQLNDPYVRRAQAEGYRARAAYKLLELDERFNLLKPATRILDLGCAPGSWCQVARKRNPRATIVGIDLLPADPLAGVTFLQGDFLAEPTAATLLGGLGGAPDLILSDMAANTVGHQRTDHLRTMALVEAAAAFAGAHLDTGGAFVAKVLAGGAESALVASLKRDFASVRHAKPPASRKDSSETYIVAQGFRRTAPAVDSDCKPA